MKYLLLVTLAFSQLSIAESMKDRNTKKEMLLRAQSLIDLTQEGRDALDKEDVVLACNKIEEIKEILPKHLLGIGTKMNLFDSDVIKIEKETRIYLIMNHRTYNVCQTGENAENLDLDSTDANLKTMNKSFKKHLKRIKKLDTNYDNTYNYHYQL